MKYMRIFFLTTFVIVSQIHGQTYKSISSAAYSHSEYEG
jgi:hypothetical protein